MPENAAGTGEYVPVLDHCFREDNCADHATHQGDECCCCGRPGDEHEGCDCE